MKRLSIPRGYKYRRIHCEYCGRSYAINWIKRHRDECQFIFSTKLRDAMTRAGCGDVWLYVAIIEYRNGKLGVDKTVKVVV